MKKRTTMEIFKHNLFVMIVIFSFVHFVQPQGDQSGFISIDCGLSKRTEGYTERTTGIKYISDEPFINSGVRRAMPLESQDGYQRQLAHLRAFPEGIRNCYTINVTTGTTYLIRATFYYGNYDNENNPPGFEIHIGANFWDTIYTDEPTQREIIHVPFQDYVRVCLANNGTGIPFISSLELRPLAEGTYVTRAGSLALHTRVDLGSLVNYSYRYPYDAFDRGWSFRDTNNDHPNWRTISTKRSVEPENEYNTAPVVLSTAITPTKPDDPLIYSWNNSGEKNGFYVYFYFSEITKLKANESRAFDIFVNGKLLYGHPSLTYLQETIILADEPLRSVTDLDGNYTISLVKHRNSTLPPILNAIEIYTVLDLSLWETYQDDVEAIMMIKSAYRVKRNWDGDPCGPRNYLWTGLNCSNEPSDPARITTLNLSSSGLTGELSPYIFNLSMLESLDLSNNELTGPVLEKLSQMTNLRVLNLDNNNFTGSMPAELLAKSKNGSIALSYNNSITSNDIPSACASSSCKTKKNKFLIPVVSSIAAFLLILLVVAAAILIYLKRRKGPDSRVTSKPDIQNDSYEEEKQQFTLSEVINMTNNFERVLGRGGFGTVYHGFIGDIQVAVKKLSQSSSQGFEQFQAEVKLLMTVYHRNLTSLIGYCIEGTNMALIYEYMTNGDLDSHLFGDGNLHVLSWEERLRIAVDSAQGLEYLHHGCKPPIVHRDIKTTNILLNDNFQAKLADFELSKSLPTEGGSHVSTVVAGTPGYLDPEYSMTNRLTEKSDVYSFGVVLLQIITSQSVIMNREPEHFTHLSQWVTDKLTNGDIKGVVDQRLNDDFDTNSVWQCLEIALACVSQNSNKRPNMSQVVVDLKECLEAELARRKNSPLTASKYSTLLSSNAIAEFGPEPK